MKIIKLDLAKIIAELPDWNGQVERWKDLPYHGKLGCICEAEKIIKVLRILNEKHLRPTSRT